MCVGGEHLLRTDVKQNLFESVLVDKEWGHLIGFSNAGRSKHTYVRQGSQVSQYGITHDDALVMVVNDSHLFLL